MKSNLAKFVVAIIAVVAGFADISVSPVLATSGPEASRYRCRIVHSLPPSAPAIRQIEIDFNWEKNTFEVVYVATSGQRFIRSTQYQVTDVSTNGDLKQWSGELRSNPRRVMTGKLILVGNRAVYTEAVYDRDNAIMDFTHEMVAICDGRY